MFRKNMIVGIELTCRAAMTQIRVMYVKLVGVFRKNYNTRYNQRSSANNKLST